MLEQPLTMILCIFRTTGLSSLDPIPGVGLWQARPTRLYGKEKEVASIQAFMISRKVTGNRNKYTYSKSGREKRMLDLAEEKTLGQLSERRTNLSTGRYHVWIRRHHWQSVPPRPNLQHVRPKRPAQEISGTMPEDRNSIEECEDMTIVRKRVTGTVAGRRSSRILWSKL